MPPRVSLWKLLLFEFVSHTLLHQQLPHSVTRAIDTCPAAEPPCSCNCSFTYQTEPVPTTTTTTLPFVPLAAEPLSSLLPGIATLLIQLALGLFQVGLGACSRRRGRVVQATAVAVAAPAAPFQADKQFRSLLAQAELLAPAASLPEPPPRAAPAIPVAKGALGGSGPKRPSDFRREPNCA
jgi:hypothetical protein